MTGKKSKVNSRCISVIVFQTINVRFLKRCKIEICRCWSTLTQSMWKSVFVTLKRYTSIWMRVKKQKTKPKAIFETLFLSQKELFLLTESYFAYATFLGFMDTLQASPVQSNKKHSRPDDRGPTCTSTFTLTDQPKHFSKNRPAMDWMKRTISLFPCLTLIRMHTDTHIDKKQRCIHTIAKKEMLKTTFYLLFSSIKFN